MGVDEGRRELDRVRDKVPPAVRKPVEQAAGIVRREFIPVAALTAVIAAAAVLALRRRRDC